MGTDRRITIVRIDHQILEDVLAGRLRCLNWPVDGTIKRTMFDASRDDWLVQIAAPSFDVIPAGERFPDYPLLFLKVS